MYPQISVVLPAYNAAPYIAEAVESILNQTFANFELIIINDCSTDNTHAIAQTYTTDPRVKVISNPKNLGLIKTLNYGFSIASAKYIARMDADDISEPTRFEKQFHIMENNSEIGICSCGYENFEAIRGNVYYVETSDKIKLNLLYKTEICHAAALIRKELVNQYTPFYNQDYPHAEDYELWARMAQYTQFYNLQEVLYKVRVLKTSVSRVFSDVQLYNTYSVIKYLFRRFGINLTDIQLQLWLKTCYADFNLSTNDINEIEKLISALLNANKAIAYVNQYSMNQFLSDKWFNICYNNIKNKEVQTIFNNSNISTLLPFKSRLKFKLKALI